MQEHKLMAEIEKHHACQEHVGKACYVTGSGEHYHYTNNDLVIWATLMVSRSGTSSELAHRLNFLTATKSCDCRHSPGSSKD